MRLARYRRYHAEQKHALYALVDPISPPPKPRKPLRFPDGWALVEAPGTAPGSERFITTAIYRHSRLAPAPINIGMKGCRRKTREGAPPPVRWSRPRRCAAVPACVRTPAMPGRGARTHRGAA